MSIFIGVLLFFPIVIVFIDSVLRLFYIITPKIRINPIDPISDNNLRHVYYLIVACNEDKVIAQTLTALFHQVSFGSFCYIGVLCDHCTDGTEKIANSFGAGVFTRNDGMLGKGPALAWFVEKHADVFTALDIIVILDADTLVEEHFCENIQRAFKPGVDVVQAFVRSVSSSGSPFTTLASFSELLSQYIDDATRSRMKWSVPLRGTGMAFRPELFCRVCSYLETQVDDIELSIRLARMNVVVFFDQASIVFDPKSSKMLGLARQRGRWLRGQRQILFLMKEDLLALLRTGLAEWSLVQALLFKPKTLLVFIKIFLFLFVILIPLFPTILSNLFVACLALSFVIDFLYYFYGLSLITQPHKYLLALLLSPIYLFLWLAGWVYSILPGQGWLRGRDE